jgi:hypothetical protein
MIVESDEAFSSSCKANDEEEEVNNKIPPSLKKPGRHYITLYIHR